MENKQHKNSYNIKQDGFRTSGYHSNHWFIVNDVGINVYYHQDFDCIYSYSRSEAIANGILVDLSGFEAAKIYNHPIACTRAVWAIVDKAIKNNQYHNSYEGVLYDICYMAWLRAEQVRDQQFLFKVIITGTGRKRYHTFKMHIGHGDDLRLVLTIMLPDENQS